MALRWRLSAAADTVELGEAWSSLFCNGEWLSARVLVPPAATVQVSVSWDQAPPAWHTFVHAHRGQVVALSADEDEPRAVWHGRLEGLFGGTFSPAEPVTEGQGTG